MIWNNVLKITFGNKIIYEKSLYKKSICIQNTKTNFDAKNTSKCKTLNMEVLEHARKC
ncbi:MULTISPECIES: hypothetical protein [Clostridium]|uniref:hypothetical protein n=1 Tax=Clostridium TaxID=1485 RepID=UPI00207AB49E|nr:MULTISPECIES: hypothetical protein [Clostridium]